MVPETSMLVVQTHARDAEMLSDICSLILHDRLSADTRQVDVFEALKRAMTEWNTQQDVVLDIHFHDVLLESWAFKGAVALAENKAELLSTVRSLLCFSMYNSWRRSLAPRAPETNALLGGVAARVNSSAFRMSLKDAPTSAHVCRPMNLDTVAVQLVVNRSDYTVFDSLPITLALVSGTPSLPLHTPVTKALPSDVGHRSSFVRPAASPDPRKRVLSGPPAPAKTVLRPAMPIVITTEQQHHHARTSLSPLSPPSTHPRDLLVMSPPLSSSMRPRAASISRSPRSCLLGSYEESLFAGSLPCYSAHTVDGFTADLNVSGVVNSKRVRLPVAVKYYRIPEQEAPSPYVGTIDLAAGLADQKLPGRFRVPASGVLQLLISNPERTGIKVFIVKYDFRAMPSSTHTFLRQRTFVGQSYGPARAGLAAAPQYAIHVRFMSSKSGKIYLYKDIRVLLAPRAPDTTEFTHTTTEGPTDPIFAPLDTSLLPKALFSPEPPVFLSPTPVPTPYLQTHLSLTSAPMHTSSSSSSSFMRGHMSAKSSSLLSHSLASSPSSSPLHALPTLRHSMSSVTLPVHASATTSGSEGGAPMLLV